MLRMLITLLCATLLTGCVSARTRYESDLVDYRIKQSAAGVNVDATSGPASMPHMPPPPPDTPGPSAGDVIGAILLLPLIVPLTMLESYPSYRGAHCYSYTYKDQYHVRCY